MHNLPLDFNAAAWEDWYGPLTSEMERQTKSFVAKMLDMDDLPDHATMILQIANNDGGLGLLNPSHRAVPAFMTSMA